MRVFATVFMLAAVASSADAIDLQGHRGTRGLAPENTLAAFARALRAGTEAVHRADPEALAGIEGGQVPGWGGYDYGLISSAVDLMEIYDAGTSLEIAQSLNPDLRTLTVNWKGDADAVRLIWRNWLLGVRGTILWDEEGEVVRPDGTPGPRGLVAGRGRLQ